MGVFSDHGLYELSEGWRGVLEGEGLIVEIRGETFHHLVDDGSHSVEICGVAVAIVASSLKSHVLGTAAVGEGHLVSFQIDPAQSKITNSHVAIKIHHYILRLYTKNNTLRSRYNTLFLCSCSIPNKTSAKHNFAYYSVNFLWVRW